MIGTIVAQLEDTGFQQQNFCQIIPKMFQNKSYVSLKSQTELLGLTVNHNRDYVPTETWEDPHADHRCSRDSLGTLVHVPEILH